MVRRWKRTFVRGIAARQISYWPSGAKSRHPVRVHFMMYSDSVGRLRGPIAKADSQQTAD